MILLFRKVFQLTAEVDKSFKPGRSINPSLTLGSSVSKSAGSADKLPSHTAARRGEGVVSTAAPSPFDLKVTGLSPGSTSTATEIEVVRKAPLDFQSAGFDKFTLQVF